MIILQLLALVTLIPLTVLMLVVFNIYLNHWVYLLFISLFGLGYATLCGFVFLSSNLGCGIFMVLAIFYLHRMRHLGKRLKARTKKEAYLAIRGSLNSKKHRLNLHFHFPLSCLNIFKWLPKRLNTAISEDLGLGIEITNLVDQLIGQSRGTLIEVNNEETSLVLEVQ